MSSRLLTTASSLVFLAGCAAPGPYAEVTGDKITRADAREERIRLLGVDDKLELTRTMTQTIEPGFRRILMDSARQGRRSKASSMVVPLNAKPCHRYYFVAVHENMTAVEPWELLLKEVEVIPECVAKFPHTAPLPPKPAG